jgi:hypothetical protein
MISLVYALFLVHSTLYSRLFTAPRLSTLSAQYTVARQIQMAYHTRNVGEPFSVSPVGFPRGDTAPSWVRGPPRDELDGHLTLGRLRVCSYKRWSELTRTNQNPHSLSSHLISSNPSSSQLPTTLIPQATMQFTAILAVLAAAVATQAAVIGVTTPLGLASPLEKRLTCSLPNGETWCLANCYAQGFCDSYCSAK